MPATLRWIIRNYWFSILAISIAIVAFMVHGNMIAMSVQENSREISELKVEIARQTERYEQVAAQLARIQASDPVRD